MSSMSTAAWVAHDLGLAAGFGGQLFGMTALNPAVQAISSKPERGLVVNRAWNGYNFVNAAALATSAITWLAGRSALSGREVDKVSRGLVTAKDVMLGTTVALGAASMACGVALGRENGGATPVETGNTPAPETPQKAAQLQRAVKVLGILTLVAEAGVIGLTAVLAMRAGKSARWGLVARLLP